MKEVKKIIRDGATLPVEFHERSNSDEITIINAIASFPLRVVRRVHELEQKYNEQYEKASDKNLVDTAIHIEGKRESYNSLLIPDIEKIQEESIPYLWLVKAFKQLEHSTENGYVLVIKDENGFRVADILLGKDFALAHKQIRSEEDSLHLKELVEEQLKALKLLSYREQKEKFSLLKQEILETYKEVEEYYLEQDRSKILFFTEEAKKAILLMEAR